MRDAEFELRGHSHPIQIISDPECFVGVQYETQRKRQLHFMIIPLSHNYKWKLFNSSNIILNTILNFEGLIFGSLICIG